MEHGSVIVKLASIFFLGYAVAAFQFGAAPTEGLWGMFFLAGTWIVRFAAGSFIGNDAVREAWERGQEAAGSWYLRYPFGHYYRQHKGLHHTCQECIELQPSA